MYPVFATLIHMEDIKALLKEAKLKVTPARLAILEALHASKKPLSVQDLMKSLKGIDSVTLYRTLESFADKNIIARILISQDRAHYEFVHHHHHHIVCTKCGLVDDIPHCVMDMIEKDALKHAKNFKAISSHSLEYFGVCKKCA